MKHTFAPFFVFFLNSPPCHCQPAKEDIVGLIRSVSVEEERKALDAMATLGEMGPSAREALPTLRKELKSMSAFRRIAAAAAIARIDPKDKTAVVVLQREWDSDVAQVREESVEAYLGLDLPKDQKLSDLRTFLRKKVPQVREIAFQTLRRMGPDAEPVLLELLDEPDQGYQVPAATLLSSLGEKKAIPVLRAALKNGKAEIDPDFLAHALYRLDPGLPESQEYRKKQVKELLALLKDPRKCVVFDVRIFSAVPFADHARAAVPLLEKLEMRGPSLLTGGYLILCDPGNKVAASTLEKFIPDLCELATLPWQVYQDMTPEVRTFGVAALGNLGAKAKHALPILEKAAKDEYPVVRAAAQKAIRQIRVDSR